MDGMHYFNHLVGRLSRRDMLRLSLAGAAGASMSGWFGRLAQAALEEKSRNRACILLWMSGGPSQIDTFDLKPGHANGGSFKEIDTATPGIKISEHLPQIAKWTNKMAIVRSITAKEGEHGRATFYVRNGYLPQGPIRYPTLGSLVSKQLGRPDAELPNFVSIAPNRAISPGAYDSGFLGPQYAPLFVGERAAANDADGLKVDDLQPPTDIPKEIVTSRIKLLDSLNERFLAEHSDYPAASYRMAYQRAVDLMHSKLAAAFKLDDEPAAVRDAYGRSRFGQGCLMARRLVERGVPFVEVTLSGVGDQALGWDTHSENFDGVKKLSEVLDPAWATLMKELDERGLLDTTLVVWMGEFGRTPKINESAGRDHYPQVSSGVLAGGGIRGGQVVGRTSADGTTIEDRPVGIPDFLATIYQGLGIDPMSQNDSNVGRPIRLVEPEAKPIQEVLG